MSRFIKCAPNLYIIPDEIASIRRRHTLGLFVVITLKSGAQHEIHCETIEECEKIEKVVLDS